MLFLWAARPRRRGLVSALFAAQFIASPLLFTKLNLSLWGTHDAVVLLHAALLVGCAGLLVGRLGSIGGAAGLLVLGSLGAGLVFLNLSLLMPWAFVMGWVAFRTGAVRSLGIGRAAAPAPIVAAVGLVLGLLSFIVCWRALNDLDLARAIGHEWVPSSNQKLRAVSAFGDWVGPTRWLRAEFLRRPEVLVPAVCAAHLLIARLRDVGMSWSRHDLLGLFVSGYFLSALLGSAALPFAYGDLGGTVIFIPRYYSHLYPVSFAVVGLWAVGGRRWRRWLVLALVLVLYVPGHVALIDVPSMRAVRHYDGLPQYKMGPDWRGTGAATEVDCRSPSLLEGDQRRRCSWLMGFALLDRYQGAAQAWTPPRDLGQATDPASQVRAHREDIDHRYPELALVDEGFARGVGCALRLLFPPPRGSFVGPAFQELGSAQAAWIIEGYEGCADGQPSTSAPSLGLCPSNELTSRCRCG